MECYNMRSPKAIEAAENAVAEAYHKWQNMLCFDYPEHQILAARDEVEARVTLWERLIKIQERLSKRGTKKHNQ